MKTQIKLLKAIDKLLCRDIVFQNKNVSHKQMISKKCKDKNKSKRRIVGLMDSANVCMVTPLNERSYNLLFHFVNNNVDSWSRSPTLDYVVKDKKISKSKYSTFYLEAFNNIAKALDEKATLCVRNDYPITYIISNDEYAFELILAPRVESD